MRFEERAGDVEAKNKTLISIVAGVVLITGAIFFMSSQRSALDLDDSGVKIVAIDSDRLKSKAKVFKVQAKLEDRLNTVILKMQDAERNIRKDYEALKKYKQSETLQKQREMERLGEKWSDISNTYKSEIQKIKQAEDKVVEIIEQKLMKVIDEFAKINKIDMIINSKTRESIVLFYSSKEVDITDIIIKKLDKEISDKDAEELINE